MAFSDSKRGAPQPRFGDDQRTASISHSAGLNNIPSTQSMSQKRMTKEEFKETKPWAHLVAGGLGGMTAATITSPLDVVKTRLQSDFYQHQIAASRSVHHIPPPHTMSFARRSLLHFRETLWILSTIHKVEGWRALFKGLGPNLTGVVPARAINFATYGNGKRMISERFNDGHEAAWVHLCSAVIAGIVTGTATNPIWLVKTRVQLDKSNAERAGLPSARRYKNSLDCIMQTLRAEGIRGLYRGLSASYLGVSESTLQWVTYEQMKKYLARREVQLVESGRDPGALDEALALGGKAAAAGTAKLFAAIITYPHEVVRTRLRQAPMQNGQMKYTGLVQCFRTIFREEGMAALYGGLTPHLMRVVPSAAIMFGMYETTLRLAGTSA